MIDFCLMLGGNNIWLITAELANHCAPEALIFTCVVYATAILLVIITIVIIDYTTDEKENGLKFPVLPFLLVS